MKIQKPKLDPLKQIKFIGYCAAFTPPESNSFDDLVLYAKTYLCIQNKILFKAHIWDEYKEEEILIEYFAHVFAKDSDRKSEFEIEMGMKKSNYDEFLEFANNSIDKNKQELVDTLGDMEESINFTPNVMGE